LGLTLEPLRITTVASPIKCIAPVRPAVAVSTYYLTKRLVGIDSVLSTCSAIGTVVIAFVPLPANRVYSGKLVWPVPPCGTEAVPEISVKAGCARLTEISPFSSVTEVTN